MLAANSRISEVMVRIHAEDLVDCTAGAGGTSVQHRDQSVIENDIRTRIAQSITNITDVTRVGFHYLDNQLSVQIEITVDDKMQVLDVNRIARKIRKLVEGMEDVHRAEIFLDLDEGELPAL